MSNADPSEYVPAAVVPAHEVALLEVSDTPTLHGALSRIMDSDLPGFVVRKAGLDGNPITSVTQLGEQVDSELRSLGYIFKSRSVNQGFSIQPTIGVGFLHFDAGNQIDSKVPRLNIHTTTEGAGKVMLAHSGAGVQKVLGASLSLEQAEQLAQYILAGTTDPDVILPTLHTAHIETGDSVVFALTNDKGPVWHRFDTSSEPRKADIIPMLRDSKAEARRRRGA